MIPSYFYVLTDIVVTSIEFCLIVFLMKNEKRKSGKWRLISSWIIFVATVVTMSKYSMNLSIKDLVVSLLIILIGKLIYECNFVRIFLFCLIFLFITYLSETIVIQIWNYFVESSATDNIIYQEYELSLVIAAKSFQILMIIILERLVRKGKAVQKLSDILLMLISSLPYMLVLESINTNLLYINNERYGVFFIFSAIVVLGAFVFNIMFNNHYLKVKKKAQEEETALYKLQVRYDYYQRRMEDEELVKEIYHDLRNHLLLSEEGITPEIKQKLRRYERYYDTGNEFLDVIVSDKYEKAQAENIHFECDIRFNTMDFIEPIDISTIFGNILDNAIEACMKVSSSEPAIFLNIALKGELLIIVVKNSMEENSVSVAAKMTTSKKNSSFHGFGLPNVRKAAKKYNGECSVNIENNMFVLSVIIPIPNVKKLGD